MSMVSSIIAFHLGNDIADIFLNLSQDSQVTAGLMSLGVLLILFAKYVEINMCKKECCSGLQKWAPCVIIFVALTLLFVQVFGCIHVRQSVMNMWFIALLGAIVYLLYKCEEARIKIKMLKMQPPIIISVMEEAINTNNSEENPAPTDLDAVDTDIVPVEDGSGDGGVSLESDVISDSTVAEDVSTSDSTSA